VVAVEFRRSSFCDSSQCVEVAFRRSSYCGGGECVEVGADLDNGVVVRDSKDPDGPRLTFAAASWSAFLAGAKTGEFDRRGR
jgi:hypothetical protein